MTDNENKFLAFLCFSQQDNGEKRATATETNFLRWGNWLQNALENFAIPADFIGQINGRDEIISEKVQPIYCDETGLAADAHLSAEVRQALERSVCLIVVCSPNSAQSQRVNEIVRYFKQLGRAENILPIVIAGEPNVSAENKSGIDAVAESFVPALRHPLQADGTLDTTRHASRFIFVDARHGVEKREVLANDHRNAEADLEMAKIQLIALLLGVGFNGLWWREQKRHFFDFAEAQQQARLAQKKVEEIQQQLQESQRQTHAAQNQVLDKQNLSSDVRQQIEEAQNQVRLARDQAQTAQAQLQEFQNQVRSTQTQLEAARQRTLLAESKVLEAQNQARDAQNQLTAMQRQAHEAQTKIPETTQPAPDLSSQIQEAKNEVLAAQNQVETTQSQLEETRQQAQMANDKLLVAQNQVQEFQNQVQLAQKQLEESRQQIHAAKNQTLTAQTQANEAQNKIQEIQNQTRDAQSQINAAQNQVHQSQNEKRKAQRLTKVFALLAVLGLLSAGLTANVAWRNNKVIPASAETFNFDKAAIQPTLQKIAGAEQLENERQKLDRLAAAIPTLEIPEALKASSVIFNDAQRSHFQKWLLLRLGWANPLLAMTNASGLSEKIVNDDGALDSNSYFQLAVLDNWLKQDFAAAFNWVCELPENDFQQRALEKTIPFLAAADSQNTRTNLKDLPSATVSQIYSLLFQHWAKLAPDSEAKTNALASCVSELAKTDAPRAWALATSLPEGTWRDELFSSVAEQTDSVAILKWLNQMNSTNVQSPKILEPWNEFLLETYFGDWPTFPVKR